MASDDLSDELHHSQQRALKSIGFSRIILPIIIGASVVGVLFYKQWDHVSFSSINWTGLTLIGLAIALAFLVGRILFYAARLQLLSDYAFSFTKCIQLIFIWEFSSAVSPTSVGGSAVSLFVLAQEKLPAAKTTAIVIYTAILDTIFFTFLRIKKRFH